MAEQHFHDPVFNAWGAAIVAVTGIVAGAFVAVSAISLTLGLILWVGYMLGGFFAHDAVSYLFRVARGNPQFRIRGHLAAAAFAFWPLALLVGLAAASVAMLASTHSRN